jgi:FkbM family methyltransferase
MFMRLLRRLRAATIKLNRVVNSDLAGLDQVKYLIDEVAERLGLTRGARVYRLRDGTWVHLRADTTDGQVFDEVFIQEIYGPFASTIPYEYGPSVLVDLGANVGLSALFLERRLRLDRIIAVEPDPGNAKALRRNLENAVAETTIIQAFAGGSRGFASLHDAGYGAWGLRMGETSADGIPVMLLTDLLPEVPGGVLLKCDIEGAERHIFPQIAQWDALVNFIILELHTEFFTWDQLQSALETSHYEWHVHGRLERGAVLAVLALERGARKMNPLTLKSGSDSRSHSGGAATVQLLDLRRRSHG